MKTRFSSLCLVLLLIALLLAACGASTPASSPPPAATAPGSPAPAASDAAPTPALPAPSPAAVETPLRFVERADSVSGEYTDGVNNRSHYRYSLPRVLGDTEDVAAVNREIDALFDTYIAPDLKHMDEGGSLVTTYASWCTAEYKGFTTLLLRLHNTWDESLYAVYPFTAEGTRATNGELLDALGLTDEAFTAAAAAKLSDHMGPASLAGKSEEIRAVMAQYRDRTLAPDNCNADMPLFVTGRGTVCFVGHVYTPAGAGQYDSLFILPPAEGFAAEELAELARDYYGMRFSLRPEAAAAPNADGTVTVTLYAEAGDPASILEQYTLSPATGAGTDSRGTPVDLTVQ